MSSNTTASSTGFDQTRGRAQGYRPEQVDRFLEELSEDRDAAWERAARLTVLANDMEAECAALREQVATLAPATFETLGPGAQELMQLVEEEAAAVRERAEVEAQYARDAAETARRTLQDEARAAASERLAAAEDQAERMLDEACGRAAEVLGQARAEADGVRGEADRALDAMRQDADRGAAEADRERQERLDALRHELAERDAGIDSRIADLLADAERRLDAAQKERAAAEEALRTQQEEAERRASAMLGEARLHEERVRRESERALRAHEEHRDEIRAHLAHVRATLATLTGRGAPPAED
ncbi:cellulose-binding protein [Streptomyces sp. NPDC049040]|uniref:cellulose-binding protein n=1 Tax=Streptomyces sp. NPDC049040 TaxID=3365593 RepID=UPI003718008D